MKLSVIVPFFDSGCEWRRRSFKWLRGRYERLLPEAEFVFGNNIGAVDIKEPFSRAAARNALVKRSTGDVLLLADADTVFQRQQIERACATLMAGAPWVIPYELGRYYNLSATETALICESPMDGGVPEPNDPSEWEHKIDSWAGLIMVPRDAYDTVRGYDERFVGWGYEDNAFRAALDNRVGHHRRIDGYALHLWHPVREKDTFDQPHISANRELCRQYEQGVLP